jgi:hypothetical protein
VIPLLLVGTGVVVLGAGVLVLRRLGPGVRVGRILASTPHVPISEARRLASSGVTRYVRVRGRLDAEEPFEDHHHSPLVLRRSRLETSRDGRWTAFEDERELVPFVVSEGLDTIAVDGAALDEGLVVVMRESRGTAGEIPDRVPPATPPETPVRLRVEQVSAVDHAIVLGVPALDEAGTPMMRAGMGRPLILTTLEPPEAMRLLAGGRRTESRIATALLGSGLALLATGIAWAVVDALL